MVVCDGGGPEVIDFTIGILDGLGDGIKSVLNTTKETAIEVWNWAGDAARDSLRWIKGAVSDTWNWITNEERIMGVSEIIGGICTIDAGAALALSPEPVSKPAVVGTILGGCSLVWAGIKKVFFPELS